MWARISELLIALWMAISYFLFSYGWEHFVIVAMIVTFAGLSYIERLNKMHLLQIVPAAWLLHISYTYPTADLPFSYQNYILIAMGLLVFAIIPSRASEHPRPWRKFLKGRSIE